MAIKQYGSIEDALYDPNSEVTLRIEPNSACTDWANLYVKAFSPLSPSLYIIGRTGVNMAPYIIGWGIPE